MATLRFVVKANPIEVEYRKRAESAFASYSIEWVQPKSSYDSSLQLLVNSTDDSGGLEISYFEMSKILMAGDEDDWPENAADLSNYAGVVVLEIFDLADDICEKTCAFLASVCDTVSTRLWVEGDLFSFPDHKNLYDYLRRRT